MGPAIGRCWRFLKGLLLLCCHKCLPFHQGRRPQSPKNRGMETLEERLARLLAEERRLRRRLKTRTTVLRRWERAVLEGAEDLAERLSVALWPSSGTPASRAAGTGSR